MMGGDDGKLAGELEMLAWRASSGEKTAISVIWDCGGASWGAGDDDCTREACRRLLELFLSRRFVARADFGMGVGGRIGSSPEVLVCWARAGLTATGRWRRTEEAVLADSLSDSGCRSIVRLDLVGHS